MGWLVGIDVGGTFTDVVAYDRDDGAVEVCKGFSTPADPADGILAGLERFAGKDRIEQLRIGTTIATNAILERTGATVAYVTTKGFRDVPFIQRGNRKYHYGAAWVKPAPLVRRCHCFELNERGLDPRRFVMLAFGGAGPPHAGALLRAMHHRAAIVPRHPGQLSAFGFTAADARVDRQRTVRLTSRDFDLERANAVLTTLVAEALAEIGAQAGVGEVRLQRSVEAGLSRPEPRARAAGHGRAVRCGHRHHRPEQA